jgi:UDP-glucose 4-epimerase
MGGGIVLSPAEGRRTVILLVGGMGFIGQNAALRLVETGERVVLTQHSARRVPRALEAELGRRVFTAPVDVTNADQVADAIRRHEVDSLINLTAPPAKSVSTQADYRLYTAGLETVLAAAQAFGLRRVSLGSSVSVYAGLPGPYREDMPVPVDSPTQVSAFKKAMEILALHWATRAKLDVVALRIGSVYGPLYSSMFNPVSRIADAAVRGTEPDFADRPGGVIYEDDRADWTYVGDVARGIALVHTAPTLRHRVYNVGSGRASSNREILDAVRAVVPGARCRALRPGRTPGAPDDPAQDLSRIKTDVGYEPEETLATGVAKYVEWLRRSDNAQR